MNTVSIYRDILTNTNYGELSENYSLPVEPDDGLNFAPGTMDGLMHYHTVVPFGADKQKLMIKAIKYGAAGDFESGEEYIRRLSEENRVISYSDEITSYIIRHSKRLDATGLHSFAMNLILNSDFTESVKFGLTILRVFSIEEPGIMEILRTLGACDEFTLFCALLMQNLENGNDELFRLAKRVHGWGRIHIVELMECTNDRIRSWLISEGIDNNVAPEYSAFTVWNKANCEELIYDEDISYECFRSIGRILVSLVSEGPVCASESLENSDEIFLGYLNRSDNFELQVEDYMTVNRIGQYLGRGLDGDDDEPSEALLKVFEIMNSPGIDDVVREAAKQGKGLQLASSLQLDLSEEFYGYLCSNFDDAVYNIGYLFLNPEYIEKALDEVRKHYKSDLFSGELTDKVFSEGGFDDDAAIRMLDELSGYPLNGADIVKIFMFAPSVYLRRAAIDTLSGWVYESGKQLFELSPWLYSDAQKLRAEEPAEIVCKSLDELLNGEVRINEEEEDNE